MTPAAILAQLRHAGHSPHLVNDRFVPGYCREPKDPARAEQLIREHERELIVLLRAEESALAVLSPNSRAIVDRVCEVMGARVRSVKVNDKSR